MGDCRIRIIVSKSLFASASAPRDELLLGSNENDSKKANSNANKNDGWTISSDDVSVSFVRVYSADTTVREVAEGNPLLNRLFFGSRNETTSTDDCIDTVGVGESSESSEFTLWDCTLHPPRDITSWPAGEYPDLVGPRSKTLHSAGCFPSGTWMAVPKGTTNPLLAASERDRDGDRDVYADVQYNTNTKTNTNTNGASSATPIATNRHSRVEFTDPSLRGRSQSKFQSKSAIPLPSEVMGTVRNRFAAGDREEVEKEKDRPPNANATASLQRKRLRSEKERAAKLEQKIKLLEEQSSKIANGKSKSKTVSDQVLRMLVKSRATGDKTLKQRDRLYCQCLVLVDDDDDDDDDSTNDCANDCANDGAKKSALDKAGGSPGREYRYFSPQDTFAKIANSFPKPAAGAGNNNNNNNKDDRFCEILCRRSVVEGPPQHRRFPVAMRVYEALSAGYLSLSTTNENYLETLLIFRWYGDRGDATKSITDDDGDDDDDDDDDNDGDDDNRDGTMLAGKDETVGTNAGSQDPTTTTTAAAAPGLNETDGSTAMDIEQDTNATANGNANGNPTATPTTDPNASFRDPDLAALLQNLEDPKAKKKKASATALKLRQMKLKFRAKGHKPVPLPDRFFLEVVVVVDGKAKGKDKGSGGTTPTPPKATSEARFLSPNDPIERVLACVDENALEGGSNRASAGEWEFLVPIAGHGNGNGNGDNNGNHGGASGGVWFRPIPNPSVLVRDAESDGLVQPYDRLVLRPRRTNAER